MVISNGDMWIVVNNETGEIVAIGQEVVIDLEEDDVDTAVFEI